MKALYGSTAARGRRIYFGQEVIRPSEIPQPEPPAQDMTTEDAASFKSLWIRFTQIWPNFLALRTALSDRAATWRQLALDRYRNGDTEGYQAILARVQNLETLEEKRSAVEATVEKFRDTWEAILAYLVNMGRLVGLQGASGPGLGFPPLLLLVGIPVALGALAYVVTTHQQIQADLDADLRVLQEVTAGRITAVQGAQIIAARHPAAAGFFAGLSGWVVPALLVGGGLYLFSRPRGG